MAAWKQIYNHGDQFTEVMGCTYFVHLPPNKPDWKISAEFELPKAWAIGGKVFIYSTDDRYRDMPVMRADFEDIEVYLKTPEREELEMWEDSPEVLLQSVQDPHRFIRMGIDVVPDSPRLELQQCVQVEIKLLMWVSSFGITTE